MDRRFPFWGIIAFCLAALTFLLPGCSPSEKGAAKDEDRLPVVVTLSFFEDLVYRVGGDRVKITALVPPGVEPEEYEPLPGDVRAIREAAVFIYNGYNMERWLPRIVPDLADLAHGFALGEDPQIQTLPLPAGPFKGEPDPHIWTDVSNAVIYVKKIASILAEADPLNDAYYRERAAAYIEELEALDAWIRAKVALIPPARRLLITSELCFQYFAAAYGFEHDAIWVINSPEEGTPSQIARIVDLVREKGVPAVFVENQVDRRPMERVSRETGVPIGGVLYSDSPGRPGSKADSYIGMMRANVKQIVEALAPQTDN